MTKTWILSLALLLGCATTDVTPREQTGADPTIARPGRILVYDFGATPSEVAPDSDLAGRYDDHDWSPEETAQARELGEAVASQLVDEIRGMGMPAERGSGAPRPQIGDILIRGNFVSIDTGSAAERMVIGFGAGSSKLTTVVEGYQMTRHGLRKLGQGQVSAGGAKGPGAAVPAAVAIAERLRTRFQEQGWIE